MNNRNGLVVDVSLDWCSYNADKESELSRRYMATNQGAPLEEQDWDSILRDL